MNRVLLRKAANCEMEDDKVMQEIRTFLRAAKREHRQLTKAEMDTFISGLVKMINSAIR